MSEPQIFARQTLFDAGSAGRSLRLQTLVRLRWLALIGQSATVVIVAYYLQFEVNVLACFILISLSALFNLALVLRFGAAFRPRTLFSAAQLAFDCLQLSGLLWLTGGLTNPFSLLLLAPVAVSATILPQRETVGIGLMAILLATGLAVSHQPLPWVPGVPLFLPSLYIVGIWVALVGGVVFVAAYVNQVSNEARQLSDALAATELALSRQQHLSALDGLAAAAAHELGTPLSTITLAAKEMRRDRDAETLEDDLDLIIDQTARCRKILARLRGLDDDKKSPFTQIVATELIEELARQHETSTMPVFTESAGQLSEQPVLSRNVGLMYGLGNFVENAVQFAQSSVVIRAEWTKDALTIFISDDGPGFAPEQLARLGEPYLTTRAGNVDENSGPGGLGLGVFIAKTLLERSGARVHFANTQPQGHAQVKVQWPKSLLT